MVMYVDRNRNGLRTRDSNTGVDRQLGEGERIGDPFPVFCGLQVDANISSHVSAAIDDEHGAETHPTERACGRRPAIAGTPWGRARACRSRCVQRWSPRGRRCAAPPGHARGRSRGHLRRALAGAQPRRARMGVVAGRQHGHLPWGRRVRTADRHGDTGVWVSRVGRDVTGAGGQRLPGARGAKACAVRNDHRIAVALRGRGWQPVCHASVATHFPEPSDVDG